MNTRWPTLLLIFLIMGALAIWGIFWLEAHKVKRNFRATVYYENHSQDKNY